MEFKSSKPELTFSLDGTILAAFKAPRGSLATLKALDGELVVSVGKWRERRSKDANSYFHLLVDKIAKALGLGTEEVKVKMVLEYGAAAEEGGEQVIVALPKSANVGSYYAYTKWIGDFTAKNGKLYSQYLLYKQTHTLSGEEMARLIGGVVYEAKELGIETRTPAELALMAEEWGAIMDKSEE